MTARPPPRRRDAPFLYGLFGLALLGLAWLAHQAAGWLGVAILGLFILFVAVRIDLEGNGPIGSQMTPGLYASHIQQEAGAERSERAARQASRNALKRPTRLAALLGALLAGLGFGALLLRELL